MIKDDIKLDNDENKAPLKNKRKKGRKKKKKKAKKIIKNDKSMGVFKKNDDEINVNYKFDKNIEATINKEISKYNIAEGNSESKNINLDEKVKKIMEYNDYEINELSYELALQCDNRSY